METHTPARTLARTNLRAQASHTCLHSTFLNTGARNIVHCHRLGNVHLVLCHQGVQTKPAGIRIIGGLQDKYRGTDAALTGNPARVGTGAHEKETTQCRPVPIHIFMMGWTSFHFGGR